MGLFGMKLFHKSGSKADKLAESVSENYNVIEEQLGLTAECREIIADPRAYYNAHQSAYMLYLCAGEKFSRHYRRRQIKPDTE